MLEANTFEKQMLVHQGRVAAPNRMNFRKNSKGPSTIPSFSENYFAIFMIDVVANMQGGMTAR